MAKRRKRKLQRDPLDFIKLPDVEINSEIKRGIFIVLILMFGALSLLSLFDLSGAFGSYLEQGLTLAFGWGKWIFPVILLAAGFIMYNEDKYYIKTTHYVGLFFFLISFQALLHFFFEKNNWLIIIEDGDGGGYLGMYLALIFHNILGFWGGLIVLVVVLTISLMLLFEKSLSSIIGAKSLIGRIFFPIKFVIGKIFSRKATEEELGADEIIDEDSAESASEIEEIKELAGGEVPEFMKKELLADENIKAKKQESKPKEEKIWKKSHVTIDLPRDLLNPKVGKPMSGDTRTSALIIQRTLENFGINVEMGDISVGPTVTQYTFKPAEGIKLSKITTLSNDLALALAAHPIRIEAPIPGKSLVGVEVPNQTKAVVGLREILDDNNFKIRKSDLMIALGKDVSGTAWLYDITKMPHLLVAGATNSGKSVCLNTIIISLLYQNDPDDLKFIMVDPKRVELPIYNGIPHLLTPVITDVSKTINALKWCLNEMDRRFEVLSKVGKRNIQTYNQTRKKGDEKMAFIVFIIDELADLMVVASKDIEGAVIRLAQMARAVGIHLILATQRPSVDVITGLIKANMPARIAFSVASGTDSKTILDSLGAEKLLGQGDMLFLTAELSKPKRIQGAYVGDHEIKKIVNYIKEKGGEAEYIEGVTERQKVQGNAGVGIDGSYGDDDALLAEAKDIVINMGKASASLLQRRLRIGYARAASILDMLEESGIIGQSNGSKPREILISKEQYESMNEQGISGVSIHNRDEAVAPENYLGEEAGTPTVFKSDEEDLAEEEESPIVEDIKDEPLAVETAEDEVSEKSENDIETEMEDIVDNSEDKIKKEKTKKSSAAESVDDEDEDEGKFFSR